MIFSGSRSLKPLLMLIGRLILHSTRIASGQTNRQTDKQTDRPSFINLTVHACQGLKVIMASIY